MADVETRVGSIETVAVRDVWPKEDADFTPWLQYHIGALSEENGLALGKCVF